jgi:hypothetical protein
VYEKTSFDLFEVERHRSKEFGVPGDCCLDLRPVVRASRCHLRTVDRAIPRIGKEVFGTTKGGREIRDGSLRYLRPEAALSRAGPDSCA